MKCMICSNYFDTTRDEAMPICEECYKRELAGPIKEEEYYGRSGKSND